MTTPAFLPVILVSISLIPHFGQGPVYPREKNRNQMIVVLDGDNLQVTLVLHLAYPRLNTI